MWRRSCTSDYERAPWQNVKPSVLNPAAVLLQEKAYVADVEAFLHIWLQESAQVQYTPHLLAWTEGGVSSASFLFPFLFLAF